jgi:hypothetical protein
MNTVHEIEQAISRLSSKELARFREWFDEFDAGVWDKQIANDAQTGKLDRLAESAIEDYHTGKAKEL